MKYIAEDFVERGFQEIVAYLNARADNGFELISVIRFHNHYGVCERYFWRRLDVTARERLDGIANIIDLVEQRCMVVDGPVTPTLQEMTQEELTAIWKLATFK